MAVDRSAALLTDEESLLHRVPVEGVGGGGDPFPPDGTGHRIEGNPVKMLRIGDLFYAYNNIERHCMFPLTDGEGVYMATIGGISPSNMVVLPVIIDMKERLYANYHVPVQM